MALDSNLDQQKESFENCRTCLSVVVGPKLLLALTDRPPNGECSLADMLYEVARIDAQLKDASSLPQFICSACCSCLVDAYDFVRKARSSNASLLESQGMVQQFNGFDSKIIDCLVETPIEWPKPLGCANSERASAGMVDIKVEAVELKPTAAPTEDDHFGDDSQGGGDAGYDDDCSEVSTGKNALDEIVQPPRRCKSTKHLDYMTRDGDGKYVCKVCDKTFSWAKALHRHALTHFAAPRYECRICERSFVRKDKLQRHLRTGAHQRRKSDASTTAVKQTKEDTKIIEEGLSPATIANQPTDGDDQPPRRGRGRPRKHDFVVVKDTNGRFICTVCRQTFAWLKTLQRHMKMHSAQPHYDCTECERSFLRKDKCIDHLRTHHGYQSGRLALDGNGNGDDDERPIPTLDIASSVQRQQREAELAFLQQLYGNARPWRSRICRLCGAADFKATAQLRSHLARHCQDPRALEEVTFDSVLVQDHFWHLKTLAEIKTTIGGELAGDRLPAKYYEIVNAHGYEMSLSDSDEDDSNEANEGGALDEQQLIYQCELCSARFRRKHEVLTHARSHIATAAKWPLRCSACKAGFLCRRMYDRHQRGHCRNRDRKFQCEACPGRFAWHANLHRHEHTRLMVLQKDSADPRRQQPAKPPERCWTATGAISCKGRQLDERLCQPHGLKTIQCMICLSRHATIADLRGHLVGHRNGALTQPPSSSGAVEMLSLLLYPDEPAMAGERLMERIMADMDGGQSAALERFYSITNEVGNELHLDSSETEDSDEADIDGDPLVVREGEGALEKPPAGYRCEVCEETNANGGVATHFRRKHQLLQHQQSVHVPQQARHVCVHCGARFVCAELLTHHYSRLCRNPRRRHLCRKCPQRFMWRDNLKMHLRTAHPSAAAAMSVDPPAAPEDRHFPCAQCERIYHRQKDLTRHLANAHLTDHASFQCLWCNRRFYRRRNFQAHVEQHAIPAAQLPAAMTHVRATSGPNGVTSSRCMLCGGVEQPSVAALRQHLREHAAAAGEQESWAAPQNYSITNALGFELNLLDDSETDSETDPPRCLEGERKTTTAQSKYDCALCPLRFKRKFEVLLHQRSMHKHEQLPFQCGDQCYFRTVCESLLQHHRRSQCGNLEKSHSCERCGLKFMWAENVQRHQELLHTADAPTKEEAPNATDGDGDEKEQRTLFECEMCGMKYVRKETLQRHIQKVHLNPRNTKTTTPSTQKAMALLAGHTKPRDKSFLCSLCGRAMTSSSNLIVHMRRHNGEKPHKCDLCEKGFARSSDMVTHRRTHTGEKPHKCTVCQKAFGRSYKLLMHMRTHSGERPYSCAYCEKSFSQSNDLTLHTRRHTGERPFGCGVCGERFIQSTALKQHRLLKGHLMEEAGKEISTNMMGH